MSECSEENQPLLNPQPGKFKRQEQGVSQLLQGHRDRFKKAVRTVQFTNMLRARRANFFGDAANGTDGSMDVAGAHFLFQDSAAEQLLPQDRISYMRANNKEALAQALQEAHEEAAASGQRRWGIMKVDAVLRELDTTTEARVELSIFLQIA